MENEKVFLYLNRKAEELQKYNPIYIAVYGSINYGLDNEKSDIDTRALVLPKFKDMVTLKDPISKYVTIGKESTEIKDMRLFMRCIEKQSINFLENLSTGFYLVHDAYEEDFRVLRKNIDLLAHYNENALVHCAAGTAINRARRTINNYSGKDLCLISFMREFIEKYINGESFNDCLQSSHKPYLMRLKNEEIPKEDIFPLINAEIEKIKYLKKNFTNVPHELNKEAADLMVESMSEILKKSLKEQ